MLLVVRIRHGLVNRKRGRRTEAEFEWRASSHDCSAASNVSLRAIRRRRTSRIASPTPSSASVAGSGTARGVIDVRKKDASGQPGRGDPLNTLVESTALQQRLATLRRDHVLLR
jgi:hypothetical protein